MDGERLTSNKHYDDFVAALNKASTLENLRKIADVATLEFMQKDIGLHGRVPYLLTRLSKMVQVRVGEILNEIPKEPGKRTDLGTSAPLGAEVTPLQQARSLFEMAESSARKYMAIAKLPPEEKVKFYDGLVSLNEASKQGESLRLDHQEKMNQMSVKAAEEWKDTIQTLSDGADPSVHYPFLHPIDVIGLRDRILPQAIERLTAVLEHLRNRPLEMHVDPKLIDAVDVEFTETTR